MPDAARVIHGVGSRFSVSDFSGEGRLYRHGECRVSSSIFWSKALFGRARQKCRYSKWAMIFLKSASMFSSASADIGNSVGSALAFQAFETLPFPSAMNSAPFNPSIYVRHLAAFFWLLLSNFVANLVGADHIMLP